MIRDNLDKRATKKMELSTREMLESDIEYIVDYFLDSDIEFLRQFFTILSFEKHLSHLDEPIGNVTKM